VAEQVEAAHILLMYDGSMRSTATRSKESAEQLARQIKEQLDSGADFGALAREHSDCPSGQNGGRLGSFGRGQMVAEFESAAFALEVDQTSDVVETPFGFHVIRRTG
jgi:peptidyl-prolyl cis-trans isomerase C